MKKKRTAPGLTYAQELQIRRAAAIDAEAERRSMVALKCACVALNDTEGLGFVRLSKFGLHLREIIDDYYKDPEVGDCQLNRRLEQMGFKIGETGGLRIGIDDDGKPIKLQAKPEV